MNVGGRVGLQKPYLSQYFHPVFLAFDCVVTLYYKLGLHSVVISSVLHQNFSMDEVLT